MVMGDEKLVLLVQEYEELWIKQENEYPQLETINAGVP